MEEKTPEIKCQYDRKMDFYTLELRGFNVEGAGYDWVKVIIPQVVSNKFQRAMMAFVKEWDKQEE